MKSSTRLVAPNLIPSHLWDPQALLLCIPNELVDCYATVLKKRELTHLCTRNAKETAPIGGISLDATNEHFAKAFDGSLARCQLAVLDPLDKLGDVSNGVIRCLAGNQVVVLDAPCGAAAAVLSILCTIAELRKSRIIPRLPLTIKLVAGDLSPYAIQIAGEMFAEIRPTLESEGIFIEEKFQNWNVTDKQSNTELVQKMIRAASHTTKRLVMISNFSGLLERERKRREATPQLEELLRHASTHDGSIALWIEPDTNSAVGRGGLFQALRNFSTTTWNKFLKVVGWSDNHPCNSCSARFRDPVNSQHTPRVGVAIVHFELGHQQ
jgi:hypothetical protein